MSAWRVVPSLSRTGPKILAALLDASLEILLVMQHNFGELAHRSRAWPFTYIYRCT